jgi:hypothetical protein
VKHNVFGDAPLQFIGGTGTLPVSVEGKPSPERAQAIEDAIQEPTTSLSDAETRPAADSPFGVEVLVAGQARVPSVIDGRSFVDLSRGEEYSVRLHNQSDKEIAVTLTIDGINMFAFSEFGDFSGQVLVPPQSHITVPGWVITTTKTDAFTITGYAESAAKELLVSESEVGVITAMFSETVEGSGRDPNATARGRQIGKAYKKVNRVVKQPIAVVSVRYNAPGQ